MIRWWNSRLLQPFLIIVTTIIMLHLLTSQLLIKSPTRSYRQGLDELGELDASILQRDKEGGVCEPLILAVLFCAVTTSLMHSVENGARRRAPSCWLFLPCTWFSPEAETCHLWSLVRRMVWGCIVQANNIPKLLWGQSISPTFTIILSHLMNGDRWKSPTLTSERLAFLPFQALNLAGICLKIPNSLSAIDFQWTQWGEIPAPMDSYRFYTAPNVLNTQEHVSCWKTHN